MKVIDTKSGLSGEELAALREKVGQWTGVGRTIEITAEGELRPVEPNVLRIGTPENYVHEVVTANITIPSRPIDKANLRPLAEEETKDVDLPIVIRYTRTVGRAREEIGFDLDTAQALIKTDVGIDLKALVALLVLRVRKLEREVEELRNAVDGRGRVWSAP